MKDDGEIQQRIESQRSISSPGASKHFDLNRFVVHLNPVTGIWIILNDQDSTMTSAKVYSLEIKALPTSP